jgi:tripartite ATP-independent transporter DctM subunit
MVVYASVTGIPLGTLFTGGIVPGLLIGAGLMVMAMFFAIRDKHPRRMEPFVRERVRHAVQRAGIGLALVVIVMTGLLSGIFTPPEAAVLACVYVIWLGRVILRILTVKDIARSVVESAVTAGAILLIVSSAYLFSVVLTSEGVPEKIAEIISGVAESRYSFLVLANLLLLFMGMIMEPSAFVVILAPILLPLALALGIHPIHFSLVMIVNANIGLATPPLGMCLFTVAPIARVKYERIAIAAMPFLAMEIAVLMLITFFPDIILFVPRAAGLIV